MTALDNGCIIKNMTKVKAFTLYELLGRLSGMAFVKKDKELKNLYDHMNLILSDPLFSEAIHLASQKREDLDKALDYFAGQDLGDLMDVEIIELYKLSLRRENDAGDTDTIWEK